MISSTLVRYGINSTLFKAHYKAWYAPYSLSFYCYDYEYLSIIKIYGHFYCSIRTSCRRLWLMHLLLYQYKYRFYWICSLCQFRGTVTYLLLSLFCTGLSEKFYEVCNVSICLLYYDCLYLFRIYPTAYIIYFLNRFNARV